ncbi:MAG: DUF4150 domain-containing protein [Gammaproteobacteria bacterium]|nr:DUF4150 domain-containing protein [Gammaproteobacteria bacterium]
MSGKLGARKDSEYIIICDSPSVNLTQIGDKVLPIPYNITQTLDVSKHLASNVHFNGNEAFIWSSMTPVVKGDEKGDRKGIFSGSQGAICVPLPTSGSKNVHINGKRAIRIDDKFYMNNVSKESIGNTIGTLKMQASTSSLITINKAGKIDDFEGKEIMCDKSMDEFSYDDRTFNLIENMASDILEYSTKYGVPAIAVAGSIADEYNTRRGFKKWIDDWQDKTLINNLSNSDIELDEYFGFDSKLLNATKHDIGVGNIKLETAKKIYDSNRNDFNNKNMNYADIVDYVLTEKGTAHIAALYIKEAQNKLGTYLDGYTDANKEAVLVTYYKQGPNYVQRYLDAREKQPNKNIYPGEGCRVFFQREKFLNIFSKVNQGE